MRNQITAATETGGSTGTAAGTQAASSTGLSASVAVSGAKSSFFKLSGLADRVRGGASATPAPAAPEQATTGESHAVDGTADDVEDREGELSLDMAERMLKWHAEAIGRCVDLSSSTEV